jgi:hypothetical protein
MRRRPIRFAMAAVALAYLVAIFLPWVPRRVDAISLTPLSGVETSWALWTSFFTGSVLFLWELGFAIKGSRAAGADRIAAVLAGTTAVLGIIGIFEARATRLPILPDDSSLAYGAWLALPLIALLALGALAQAAVSIRTSMTVQQQE